MAKWRDTFKGYERARVNGKLKQDNRRLSQEGERMTELYGDKYDTERQERIWGFGRHDNGLCASCDSYCTTLSKYDNGICSCCYMAYMQEVRRLKAKLAKGRE